MMVTDRPKHEITSLVWDDDLIGSETHRGDCARIQSQAVLLRDHTAQRREQGLPGGVFDTREELIELLRQREECTCR